MKNDRKVVKVKHRLVPDSDFKSGTYQHYKGDYYIAFGLAWANEMLPNERVRVVIYYSIEKNQWNTRPYTVWASEDGYTCNESWDAWTDDVLVSQVVPEGEPRVETQDWEPRFRYVGPQPIGGG